MTLHDGWTEIIRNITLTHKKHLEKKGVCSHRMRAIRHPEMFIANSRIRNHNYMFTRHIDWVGRANNKKSVHVQAVSVRRSYAQTIQSSLDGWIGLQVVLVFSGLNRPQTRYGRRCVANASGRTKQVARKATATAPSATMPWRRRKSDAAMSIPTHVYVRVCVIASMPIKIWVCVCVFFVHFVCVTRRSLEW